MEAESEHFTPVSVNVLERKHTNYLGKKLQFAQTLIEKNINKNVPLNHFSTAWAMAYPQNDWGGMENNNIYFRYTDASPLVLVLVMGLVLHDLLLSIAAGSYVVLFGLSGGGKSTLLKLMTGLLRPDKGGVFLDGNNISDFDIDRARQQIGVVILDYCMVSGSLPENILSERIFSNDEIINNLPKVGAGDYLKSMPKGIYTHISESFYTFSAGRIQLLALARSLIEQPRMLIFDEAISVLRVWAAAEFRVLNRTAERGSHRVF